MEPEPLHSTNAVRCRTNSSRPYRSKRHPPCDECRRKKLRCQVDSHSSCQRCLTAGYPCSFAYPLHRRRGAALSRSSASPTQQVATINSTQPEQVSSIQQSHPAHLSTNPPPLDLFAPDPTEIPSASVNTHTQTPIPFVERHAHQTIQTLDGLDGFSYQVIGASGESDPWLLRHCKFNDKGFLLSHQVHFRNAGGVPLDEKIPVHFLVTADRLYESSEPSPEYPSSSFTREELDSLVSQECGQRLVVLFFRFVFPTLPVLSCSQFDLAAAGTVPDPSTLQRTPVCLLAAIYASALPFAKFDDYLCLIYAYSLPSTDRLWRMVLALVLQASHTPRLATLQAGILYLHRPISATEGAVADSVSVWSFVGMLVGIATSLGLQLECKPMGLPAWERRIRRRLWWAMYAEDKWRSLLMGRPSYIRNDEWDVTDLGEEDFSVSDSLRDALQSPSTDCNSSHEVWYAQPFQHFIRLSRIADELQQSLYALRSAQRLCSDFHATLETARPLLQKLKEWSEHLPASLRQQTRPTNTMERVSSQLGCLRFACILLEVFVFRALLRPMVRSAAPPPLYEETHAIPGLADQFDDLINQLFEVDEFEPSLAIDLSEENGGGSAVLQAAENCAAKMLRMVMRVGYGDTSGFWYSWSRIGFATVSNFLILLLVQAPTQDHALRAKRLVDLWRNELRNQKQSSSMVCLGLVRLEATLWAGLSRNYYLPRHVKEILERE
ncbi:fungal-specific transcription factor domain protein [Aspergillus japonicus CBS 114.51]|uniref:Fungal-specific transcription factor domain protein n=1 Tax=Aspergillus japonicus CBS 114.51 TaxID=1448312 RepID=A0A8T8XFL6_ASPJA|nr:fungal-specific transcription factor domain protein [Aspergillus japonicus CBS 114.51]RAH86870.1 fungal-specific transcription factor domain protein [Aspergillus japonicus CBS 114.51]